MTNYLAKPSQQDVLDVSATEAAQLGVAYPFVPDALTACLRYPFPLGASLRYVDMTSTQQALVPKQSVYQAALVSSDGTDSVLVLHAETDAIQPGSAAWNALSGQQRAVLQRKVPLASLNAAEPGACKCAGRLRTVDKRASAERKSAMKMLIVLVAVIALGGCATFNMQSCTTHECFSAWHQMSSAWLQCGWFGCEAIERPFQ